MTTSFWFRELKRDSLIVLAPLSQVPARYSRAVLDEHRYDTWLHRAQALRGRTYLADGALQAGDLTSDGRLVSDWDRFSWHIIARDSDRIHAAMRLTFHRSPIDPFHMGIANSGLFQTELGQRYLRAIRSFQKSCFATGGILCEAGGWAVDFSYRGRRPSAAVVLSSWPIARSQGRVHTLATVTSRNHSHEILTRMGALGLHDFEGELPSWNDPVYGCTMHLSDMASWRLNKEFEPAAGQLAAYLDDAPLLMCREVATMAG